MNMLSRSISPTPHNNTKSKSTFNYETTMKKFAFKNNIPMNNKTVKTVKISLP